jgi:tRNA(Ile)-lysidine synthase
MDMAISTIENFLQTLVFQPGGKILAAVSGGADSVAMLHILCTLRQALNLEIICAHINHQLRDKESDEDEQFTAKLCDKLNAPFFAECIDVKSCAAQKKLSIETAARQLRLAAIERIARRTGCGSIATAHHKDDQAETVLFRLLRGTAFAGLAGIRPAIERTGLQWIRPMLHIRRTQIESYCRQNNLSWRDDASNLETHFRRNWIRHRLLPFMQQNSENDLTEKLAALAESALSLQQQVETAADEILKKSLVEKNTHTFLLRDTMLQQAGPFIAGEILRTVLNHLGRGLQDMSLSHYRRFFQLLDKNRAVLELPGGCVIRKKNDIIKFKTTDTLPDVEINPPVKIPAEGTTQFGNWRIQTRLIQITQSDLKSFQEQRDNSRQWFDWKQIQSPLIARDKQECDRFVPFGRKTSKKITRFLTDSQIDPKQKESCFVIEDKTGILWLAPLRRAARSAVVADTINVLEIRVVPLPAKI